MPEAMAHTIAMAKAPLTEPPPAMTTANPIAAPVSIAMQTLLSSMYDNQSGHTQNHGNHGEYP